MNESCILSTAYWGPVQYFTKFELYKSIVIEPYEYYKRQSYRNRCTIYGPNGLQDLNVPVQKSLGGKLVVKDVKVSYDTKWQHNHLKAIEAAYNSSPFYEFYIDDVLPIYKKAYKYLYDMNTDILNLCLEWLNIDKEYEWSSKYHKDFDGNDYRESIHPKVKRQEFDHYFENMEYMQGFELRHGFIPNLSVLDLVFNMGPESRIIILNSIKKAAQ